MKLLISSGFLVGRWVALGAVWLVLDGASARSWAQEPTPLASPTGDAAMMTAAALKPGKKERSKKSASLTDAPPVPLGKKPSLAQMIPLQPGDAASRLKIPETDLTGHLLSQLMAVKATRIDAEHIQMDEMHLDLYHPDGKEDFHILMPTSIFDLNTRIISSRDPVSVRTDEFELTGERMEFNTVDRTGRLIGKVRMLIHNFKQVAGQADPVSKPE